MYIYTDIRLNLNTDLRRGSIRLIRNMFGLLTNKHFGFKRKDQTFQTSAVDRSAQLPKIARHI